MSVRMKRSLLIAAILALAASNAGGPWGPG